MGAQLVGKAFAFAVATSLKPNEKTLLIWMAFTALDSDQPPRYFASREESAYGLGRMVADRNTSDPVALAERASAFQLVKVATQGLVESGAIERVERGRSGHRAVFALTFRGKGALPIERKSRLPRNSKPSLPDGVSATYPLGTTDESQEELPGRTPRFTQAPRLRSVDNTDERKSA